MLWQSGIKCAVRDDMSTSKVFAQWGRVINTHLFADVISSLSKVGFGLCLFEVIHIHNQEELQLILWK
jgi:hypothetical protein